MLSKTVLIIMIWFFVNRLQIFEVELYFYYFMSKKCWRHRKFWSQIFFWESFRKFLWLPSFGTSFNFLTSLLTILRGVGHLDLPQVVPFSKKPSRNRVKMFCFVLIEILLHICKYWSTNDEQLLLVYRYISSRIRGRVNLPSSQKIEMFVLHH